LFALLAATRPTAGSAVRIVGISHDGNGLRVDWTGGVQGVQWLERKRELGSGSEPWSAVFTNEQAPAHTNVVDLYTADLMGFYRITYAPCYYVSTNGSDSADGRSRETAFRTIGHALSEADAGDFILVLPGTYNEGILLENVEPTGSPVTVRGHGGTPTLDGQGTRSLGIWCEQCSNLVFENMAIRNYTDIGIGVSLCSEIVMRDLTVHSNGFDVQLTGWELEGYGIHVEESSGVTVENCEAYENGPASQSGEIVLGTGINTYMATDSVLRGNRSHHNVGGGFLVEDGENVLVEGNEAYENYLDASADEWWDGGIWVDGGHDIVVRSNVFRNNLGPGIEISDEDYQSPTGYVFEANVSTGNYYGIYIWNFGTTGFPPDHVLQMSDNEISGNTLQDVWISAWE